MKTARGAAVIAGLALLCAALTPWWPVTISGIAASAVAMLVAIDALPDKDRPQPFRGRTWRWRR